ncbi:MAG: putative toxin-antitoxin system toxin component, PIN family [Brachymonas sp.]|jgi:putative PIN family toxin of toxin-antitoxin system
MMSAQPEAAPQKLVIDTNIALDILVFNEPKVAQLKTDLAAGLVQWLATAVMRDELERVLAYAQIAPRVAFYGLNTAAVLAAFDAQAQLRPIAPKVAVDCKDADDQKFLDLAVQERALLLSKDKQVLKCRKRLQKWGGNISPIYPLAPVLV